MANREFATYRAKDVVHKHRGTYLIPKPKYGKDWAGIKKVTEHEVSDNAVKPDVQLYLNDEEIQDVQVMYVRSYIRNG